MLLDKMFLLQTDSSGGCLTARFKANLLRGATHEPAVPDSLVPCGVFIYLIRHVTRQPHL